VKVTLGCNCQGLDPSATAERALSECLVLRIGICGQIRIKRFQHYDKNAPAGQTTESRSCFYADSTGREVQPVKPDGEDARSRIASNAFPRSVPVPIDQFRSKISLREKNRRSRCSFAR
jgi:hypothetical protein